MRVWMADSVEDLPSARWDALTRGAVYCAHPWQRYQETSAAVESRYVVVSDGDRWLAAASVFLIRGEPNSCYWPPSDSPRVAAPETTVLVGNRRGYANQLLLAHDARDVVETLVSSVQAVAEEFGHSQAWWMYLDQRSAQLLQPYSATPVPWLLDADCSIDLPGIEFDDYLNAVGPSVRKRVRRDRALFGRAGYRSEELDLIDCAPELAVLVSSLERRHGRESHPKVLAEMLVAQAKAMGPAAKVDACFADDRMVGANLRLDGDGVTVSRACGFDYGWLRDACEYFELVYYRPIEAAYRSGNARVGLGIGTYEAKIRRGARAELRWAVATGAPTLPHMIAKIRTRNRARLDEMSLQGLRRVAIRDVPEADWTG